MWHGLPLVRYPQTPEQHGVANRVAARGAGVPLTDPAADGIRCAVETALTDPSYRENAQKLADGFRRSGGAVEAADAIEHAANLVIPCKNTLPPTAGACFLCYVNPYSFFSR